MTVGKEAGKPTGTNLVRKLHGCWLHPSFAEWPLCVKLFEQNEPQDYILVKWARDLWTMFLCNLASSWNLQVQRQMKANILKRRKCINDQYCIKRWTQSQWRPSVLATVQIYSFYICLQMIRQTKKCSIKMMWRWAWVITTIGIA